MFSRSKFSCSLKCYSSHGTLYSLKKEQLMQLRSSEHSWLSVMEKIIQKESRQQATHLCNTPRNFEKEERDREKAQLRGGFTATNQNSIQNLNLQMSKMNPSQLAAKMEASKSKQSKARGTMSVTSMRKNTLESLSAGKDEATSSSPAARERNFNS